MVHDEEKAKRWRPLRFSLREIFLLTLAVALGVGWYLERQKSQGRDLLEAEYDILYLHNREMYLKLGSWPRPLDPNEIPEPCPLSAAERLADKLKEHGHTFGANVVLREHLQDQAKRMTAHLGNIEMTHQKTRWSSERQQYVVQ